MSPTEPQGQSAPHSGEHPYSTLHMRVLCCSPGRPCCWHPHLPPWLPAAPLQRQVRGKDCNRLREGTGPAQGIARLLPRHWPCAAQGGQSWTWLPHSCYTLLKGIPHHQTGTHTTRTREGVKGTSYWCWVVQVHPEPVLQPGFPQRESGKENAGKGVITLLLMTLCHSRSSRAAWLERSAHQASPKREMSTLLQTLKTQTNERKQQNHNSRGQLQVRTSVKITNTVMGLKETSPLGDQTIFPSSRLFCQSQ